MLTDKERKKIVADYVTTGNLSEAARINGVSRTTVRKIVQQEGEVAEKIREKSEENTAEILEELGKQAPKVARFCEVSLDRLIELAPRTNNVRDLATAMGIMIDKYTRLPAVNRSSGPYELPARVLAPAFASVFLAVSEGEYTEFELAGGRGSTKSSFVSLMMVWLLKNNPEFHGLCVRKVGNTLRNSVFAQVMWAIGMLGLDAEFDSTVSPMEITLVATGQKIYFRGADDPKKLKSVTPPFGYIGALWFEELDQFAGDEEVRSIRQSVIRGGDKACVFKTYNPPKTLNNWVNLTQQTPKAGRLLHKSTYLDVPPKWLGQSFIDEAEYTKQVNPAAYEHEYLAIPNGSGGMVFENVVQREITDEELAVFDRIYDGVDWGYYPDPWAWNRVHYDAARRVLYIYRELTMYKAGNRQTADALLAVGVQPEDRITADSAEPKSVQDYRNFGLYCRGAAKGPGSVDYSMKWLQALVEIVIDPVRCPDTAKEFTAYEYERTRDGAIISGYPDKDNHHIDAVRYATEPIWKRRGQ